MHDTARGADTWVQRRAVSPRNPCLCLSRLYWTRHDRKALSDTSDEKTKTKQMLHEKKTQSKTKANRSRRDVLKMHYSNIAVEELAR